MSHWYEKTTQYIIRKETEETLEMPVASLNKLDAVDAVMTSSQTGSSRAVQNASS